MNLHLDYVHFYAARYAVENWHYSKIMPAGKLIKFGVWEDTKFIGAVIFSRGSNNHLLIPYGLKVTEGCELTRIALREHQTPVTRIISIAVRLLKRQNPGLKLIVSFADSRQNHLGKIYQAGNWIYTGAVKSTPEWFYRGKWRHQRTINSLRGTLKGLTIKRDGGYRFRYLFALDNETKQKILKFQKPYVSSISSLTVERRASSSEVPVQIRA